MKGYIYTMFKGADPSVGWKMTDPIYGKVPTMGACMPNIRRLVEKGDFIFSVSGRVATVVPHIVGGFQVDDKINALIAYKRFPDNRMVQKEDGGLAGNIIVDAEGNHLPFDYHDKFEKRLENYVVGKNALSFETLEQMNNAKKETVDILNEIFNKKEDSVSKIIGRCRKLDESQIKHLLDWMNKIKAI